MSRILAAKAALATRVDAMGSSDDATIGLESRAKVHKVPRLVMYSSLGIVLCGGSMTTCVCAAHTHTSVTHTSGILLLPWTNGCTPALLQSCTATAAVVMAAAVLKGGKITTQAA